MRMSVTKKFLVAAGLSLSGSPFGITSAVADELPGTGSLSGSVVAEEPFQAAQVYAHNAEKQMTYVVYTSAGQYRAINLLPGTYEVSVAKPGFGADPQQVVVESGATARADFRLDQADVAEHAVVGSARGAPANSELVPYDELFPAGRGRDTLERTCMTCHGRNFIPLKSGLNEAGWNVLLDLMLGLDDSYWSTFGLGGPEREGATPMLPESITISDEERAELVSYLARHFGPGTLPRMVLNDEVTNLDEEALGKAMWIEYSVPDPTSANGLNRAFQEPFFDLDGNVWLTEITREAPAIVRLDPRTAMWSRFPMPDNGWYLHGIVTDPGEAQTMLWTAGRGFDVARLDPATGEIKAYGDTSSNFRWGGHTPVFDSTGDLWYTGIQNDTLGKWDRETDDVKTWTVPTQGSRPYGVIVDRDDKVWFANLHTCMVTSFDPDAEEFTEYVSPSAPCAVRRLGLDSNGIIWYGAFSDGRLGKIDPETGKITEYEIGRFAEPYEAYADLEDNIWVTDGGQNMLVRFDQETEQFTYYPAPLPHSDRPKMHITRDGAVWYPNRGAAVAGTAPAKAGVLYPDMDRMTTLGAYFAVEDGRAVGTGSPTPAR